MDRYILAVLVLCIIMGAYLFYTIKKGKKAAQVTEAEKEENVTNAEENSLPKEEEKPSEKVINENATFFDIIDIDSIEEDTPEEISENTEQNSASDLFNLFTGSSEEKAVKEKEVVNKDVPPADSDPYGILEQKITNTKPVENVEFTNTPIVKNSIQPSAQSGQSMNERIASIINELNSIYNEAQLEEITKLLLRRTDLNAKTIKRIIDKNAEPDKIRKYAQRYS